jgi:hypothetical protein
MDLPDSQGPATDSCVVRQQGWAMRLSTLVVGVSLIGLPLTAAKSTNERTQHQLTTHQMTLEDRVTVLEETVERHEAQDAILQSQERQNANDWMRSQGKQDDRISLLEARQQVVYQTGTVLAWIIGIFVAVATTLFTVFYQQYRTETAQRHQDLQERLAAFAKDLKNLEKHLYFVSKRAANLPQENLEDLEVG